MTRFEWDGLRKGDAVFVHHPITSQSSALSGAVEFVTVRAGVYLFLPGLAALRALSAPPSPP